MTWEQIKANHRDDIKRQAILFYKSRACFEGDPRRKRWTACVRMVVESWMALGPQLDSIPTRTICLPANAPNNKLSHDAQP